MLPFFKDYLERFEELHVGVRDALQGLPGEALDWTPGPEMNSLTVLVTHLTGAERYWLGDVGAGDPAERDRDAEFRTHGVDAGALIARLAATEAYAREMLRGLALEDLEGRRVSRRDGREYSLAWCLLHALEHTAVHLGHIQQVRQLWERRS